MLIDPAHDLAHLDRVWLNAQAIADVHSNQRVLLAASYLHDLVNLPKDDPNRHLASQQSATKSEPILAELGFTEVETRATQHAIAAHSYSANIDPETPEACILRDADRLDALGAIGIARTFSVSGALGRALYDTTDPFGDSRPMDDQRFSIDHWKIKLLKLPNVMLTTKGKVVAKERSARMIRFLQDLSKEIDTPLPPDWANL
ncbi:uncharacterized protein SAMN05444358_10445 [Ruegeria halocynthiae]|uniref:HD/PDEase domain-containing protein n=2 Tax=Ruegeria halocynthiae TaxID=985054 RepID=A0A1H3A663_9RHOB|nr:uncharacterized protein SAMN05444358_10445 [Ruegeria halocynthiae]